MRDCELRDLGRLGYAEALGFQQQLVDERKRGSIPDQLLFVEHSHVITAGRNARSENLLVSHEELQEAGIAFFETNRGGDFTYHGPGQVVAYLIFDLKEWKRDVMAYVRALESSIINALAGLGVIGQREPGATGVWIGGAKIAAIGVHITRWVTYHGFALNVTTNLEYFRYIVPCGIRKPVTSLASLGSSAGREQILSALVREISKQFELRIVEYRLRPAHLCSAPVEARHQSRETNT